MTESPCKAIDPRILRTRQLLQHALASLLKEKEFENISVQDIAEAATVNRATFYDHYPDKFALLECTLGSRFHELLRERGIKFDSGCSMALKAMILGVCDFLAGTLRTGLERQGQMEPHMESAVIAVVRRMILDGLKHEPSANAISPEMIATTVSWAIYGAAKEWARTPNRCPSEEVVDTVMLLVSPMLALVEPDHQSSPVADGREVVSERY
jgi:AcrR family transcriptional regulator